MIAIVIACVLLIASPAAAVTIHEVGPESLSGSVITTQSYQEP